MGDEDAGTGVPENKIDFLGSEPVIERHQNRIGQGRRKIGLQKYVAVILEDGYPVAGLEPLVPKNLGQTKNPLGKGLIRENTVVTANGLFVGISPGRFEQQFG